MQLRMPARLLASVGALALAATLSSCGFDYATDREYTPTAGVNDRDAQVERVTEFLSDLLAERTR